MYSALSYSHISTNTDIKILSLSVTHPVYKYIYVSSTDISSYTTSSYIRPDSMILYEDSYIINNYNTSTSTSNNQYFINAVADATRARIGIYIIYYILYTI